MSDTHSTKRNNENEEEARQTGRQQREDHDEAPLTENDDTVPDTQLHRLSPLKNFKRVNELHRFALLLLGLFSMVCGSFGSYLFNLVSGALQTRYHLSQRDLSAINTCGSVIGNVMLPYSFLYDYFGPLPIAIISIVVFPLGALLMALTFQEVITGNVVKLCVFYSFMNVGTSFYDLTSCVTILSYFPINRGAVIALLKTFIGLGSAIVGCIYVGFYRSAPIPLFYTLMAFAIVIAVLSTFFMKLPEYQLTIHQSKTLAEEEKQRREATKSRYLLQKPPMYRFYIGFAILVFLIIWLPLTSALSAYLDLHWHPKLAFAVVTMVFVVGFTLIAFPYPRSWDLTGAEKEKGNDSEESSEHIPAVHDGDDDNSPIGLDEPYGFDHVDDNHNDGTSKPHAHADGSVSTTTAEKTELDYIAPQYQTGFLHNLLTVDLWALFWTIFVLDAVENMIMSNASYIFAALSGEVVDDDLRALLSVLNGVGSAAGRLLMSYFENWTQHRPAEKRIPITACFFFPTTTLIIAIVLLLALPASALPLPYVIAAIGNGFLAASQILVTKTIYAKDSAKHYHMCFLADAFGAVLVDRFLYGEWYTVEAEKLHVLVCLKKRCVLMPLVVSLGLSCTAFLSAALLHIRYWRYSKRMVAERLQSGTQMGEAEAEAAHRDNEGEDIHGVLFDPLEATEANPHTEKKASA